MAHHSASGDRVALKWIELTRPNAAEVARSEAALLARLDHPNLIALREFRICAGGFVLVLELADAGSLANLLRRRDKLTPSEVVAAVSPIAAALAHAHAAGVLHGDVSPANILFTTSGHPKLADLGVARMIAAVGAGTGMGPPAYLDPAIAAGGAAGIASDVFSLAAVALRSITGAGPWHRRGWRQPGAETPSADEVMAIAATGEIEDLAGRLAGVPPAMAAALTRALDRDPSRRGSAAEFALDVRASLPPTPVVLAGGRVTAPVGRHAARPRTPAPVPSDPPAQPLPADFSGPEFVPADLTRISRPLIRATRPPAPEPESSGRVRAILDRMVGGSLLRAAVVTVLIGLLVAAGVIGWPLLRRHDPQAAAAARPSAGVDPMQLLTRLDDLRSQAYAERRPALLQQVYGSADLLAADTRTLTGTVPTGCRLTGLHTDYGEVTVVSRTNDRIRLKVQASLPVASLTCPDQPVVHTRAVPASGLIIDLADSPEKNGGFRIAGLTAG